MKLWLLSQNINNDYDTFDAIIVAAETKREARLIGPKWGWDESDWTAAKQNMYNRGWVLEPSQVEVKYLGEAADNVKKGLILASFNAG